MEYSRYSVFTPEALLNNRKYRKLISSDIYHSRIYGLVIDEAHTAKKWYDYFQTHNYRDVIDVSLYHCRATTFRESLSRVGEIRSLLPSHVKVMALTATKTHSLRVEIIKVIGTKEPVMVVLPPCKTNIKYNVVQYTSIDVKDIG